MSYELLLGNGFFSRAGGIIFWGIAKNSKNRQALQVFAERENRLSGATESFKSDSERNPFATISIRRGLRF
jgi:hypothetical protein